jgi:hypothetical protein
VSDAKTLVIGSSGHGHVTCIEWSDVLNVNVLDYHQVVLNCRPLTGNWLSSVPWDYFKKLRTTFCRLLDSRGRLIALGTETRTGKASAAGSGQTTYSWCPFDIATEAEAGDTVTIQPGEFDSYLSKLKTWKYWYRIPASCLTHELTDFFGSTADISYKIEEENIATNRYGKALAAALTIKTRDRGAYEGEWDAVGPPIVVLPDIPELETREALNLILEDLLGVPQISLPPAWASQVSLPGVAAHERKIGELYDVIRGLEGEIAGAELLKAELESYKKLLYATGPELEQVFRKCLETLGATTSPARYSQEEFIFDFEGTRCLVECKGVSKSAARAHVNQLTTYVDKYEEDEGSVGKGVLLVNAWRNLAPAVRGQEATPIFPPNVVERATQLRFALVSSVEFFDAFCRFLNREVEGGAIVRKLINTAGIVDFSSR